MPDAASAGTARRDWVQEAYQAFIANASGLDPTDPVKAVGAYFEKTASDELKARAKAEGRTPAKCWRFVEAVARKALNGRSGHVDPSAVYAIAMHWYEDVPVDWDAKPAAPAKKREAPAPEAAATQEEKAEYLERNAAAAAAPAGPAKPDVQDAQEPPKAAKPARPASAKKKPKDRQTFFFDILAGGNGASVG